MSDPSSPRQSDGIPMLECPSLQTMPRIRHGFFTRQGGVSQGIYDSLNCGSGSADKTENIEKNRALALDRLSPGTNQLITPRQIHSAKAITLASPPKEEFSTDSSPIKGDALITNHPGLAIGILSADCAPVIFADDRIPVIGIAHAGWQGALNGILEATLHAMHQLGARSPHIQAVIGPCIAQASYEVSIEFLSPFLARDDNNAQWFANAPEPQKRRFDLAGYVTHRLQKAGIGQISRVAYDTYQESTYFFSYRRACHNKQTDYGRALSAVMIDP